MAAAMTESPTGASEHRTHLRVLVGTALVLIAVATTLWATGTSRAVGIVVYGISGAVLLFAASLRIRGVWPPRFVVVAFSVVLTLIALYGIWLWVYAVRTPNVAV